VAFGHGWHAWKLTIIEEVGPAFSGSATLYVLQIKKSLEASYSLLSSRKFT